MMLIKKTAVLLLCVVMLLSCAVTAYAEGEYVTDGENVYLAGDLNGDNTVDVLDYVQAVGGTGARGALDLNGSGAVDNYDYALLRARVLGIDKSIWS